MSQKNSSDKSTHHASTAKASTTHKAAEQSKPAEQPKGAEWPKQVEQPKPEEQPTQSGDAVAKKAFDDAESGKVDTREVIQEAQERRGPSLMETTMSAANNQGRPAMDAHAAAEGIVVTKEDQKLATEISEQVENGKDGSGSDAE